MAPADALAALVQAARTLPQEKLLLLGELAHAIGRPVASTVNPDSDIVSSAFNRDFSARLVLFHAMHDAALTKKTFEYLFCGSSRAAGRTARQTVSGTHPGEDVVVDGRKFSLKTEGGVSIRRDRVQISKLMEARWIRECRSRADFCSKAQAHIGAHLAHYERILCLRAFPEYATKPKNDDEIEMFATKVRYDLIELPDRLGALIMALEPADFTERTNNGSSTGKVHDKSGNKIFSLVLDGSVEKVTISGLVAKHCTEHASWEISLHRQT